MKQRKSPVLSVIVPCYNEEKNIPPLVEGLSWLGKSGHELIIVDNGSTDGSAKVMEGLAKRHGFVRVVTVKKNTGYGNGILEGLKKAKGRFLCWTHADLQADPKDVEKALKIALESPEPEKAFVKGLRTGRNFTDSFFTFGMSVFCSLCLGAWLGEINAQPNLFHRSFLKKILGGPKDFSFDLYALYMARKNWLAVKRFPVEFRKRRHGVSSWNTGLGSKIKFIKRTIDFTLKLRQRLRVGD